MVSVNDEFWADKGAVYRVRRKLGEGVTAEVYEAESANGQESVVLKMVRPTLTEKLTQNFWREQEILHEFAVAEKAAEDGVRAVPALLDVAKTRTPKFLVLEYVRGTPLDELLNAQPHLWLPERVALQIAERVLRVLHLLHTELRRTYTDFQMQNIRVTLTDKTTLTDLKVIDWNHVSNRTVAAPAPLPEHFGAEDLIRLATYLYRMVTGKIAPEQGALARKLMTLAGAEWERSTDDLREVLVKALHPTITYRYSSAAEFRYAVQRVIALWDGWHHDNWPDLMYEIRQKMQTPDPTNPRWRTALLSQLIITEQLGAKREVVQSYREQLLQGNPTVVPEWEVGQRFFEIGQYRAAIERWRGVAESYQQVGMWRQLAIAEAAVALGEAKFLTVQGWLGQARQAIETGTYDIAESAIEAIRATGAAPHTLTLFENEIAVHRRMAELNRRRAFTNTSAKEYLDLKHKVYTTAADALKALPADYAVALREEHRYPDFEQEAIRLKAEIKQWEIVDRQLASVKAAFQSETESDDSEALQTLTEFLTENPHSEAILTFCLEQGKSVLNKEGTNPNPRLAVTIFDLALGLGNPQGHLLEALREAWREAWRAYRGKELEQEHEKQVRALEQALVQKRLLLQQEHEKKVSALEQAHQQTLKAQEIVHGTAKVKMAEHYQSLLYETRTEHTQQLTEANNQYYQALANAQDSFKKELEAATEQFEEEKRQFEKMKKQGLTEIEEKFAPQYEALLAHHDKLRSEIEAESAPLEQERNEIQKEQQAYREERIRLQGAKNDLEFQKRALEQDKVRFEDEKNTFDFKSSARRAEHYRLMKELDDQIAQRKQELATLHAQPVLPKADILHNMTSDYETGQYEPQKVTYGIGNSGQPIATSANNTYQKALRYIGEMDLAEAKKLANTLGDKNQQGTINTLIRHFQGRNLLKLGANQQDIFFMINQELHLVTLVKPEWNQELQEVIKIIKDLSSPPPWSKPELSSITEIIGEARRREYEADYQKAHKDLARKERLRAYAWGTLAFYLANFIWREIVPFQESAPKLSTITDFTNRVKENCKEYRYLPYHPE